MLVDEYDTIYSFDSDDDGVMDLYLEISDPGTGPVTMNTTYFSLAGVERQRNTCQVQKMVMQKNVDLWELVSGA